MPRALKWIGVSAAVGVACLVFALVGGPTGIVQIAGSSDGGYTTSRKTSGYFFRLKTSYLHNNEIVSFDIVAGCSVTVTGYADGGSSHDSFLYPWHALQETKDGGVVAQIVPKACSSETSDNGEVPLDFLPGAVWFPDKADMSLGIAHVTEDAFNNPHAQLRFLGATITKATAVEWHRYRSAATPFALGEPLDLPAPGKRPTEEEWKAHIWDKAWMTTHLPAVQCKGMARYRLSEPEAQSIIREYWPKDRPRYWMLPAEKWQELWMRLRKARKDHEPLVDGQPFYHISATDQNNRQYGFPTFARGGEFRNRPPFGHAPAKLFPMKQDEGIPWFTQEIANADVLYRDVELANGGNLGLLYCFLGIGSDLITAAGTGPEYAKRQFATRVDGHAISGEDADSRSYAFFENDQFLYQEVGFSY